MNSVKRVLCFLGLWIFYSALTVANPLHEYLNNPETRKEITASHLLTFLKENPINNIDEVDPSLGTAFYQLVGIGKSDIMAAFFALHHPDVNKRSFDGDMPLHFAIRKFGETKLDVIQLLINMHADCQAVARGQTARELALERGYLAIVEMIDRGALVATKEEARSPEQIRESENNVVFPEIIDFGDDEAEKNEPPMFAILRAKMGFNVSAEEIDEAFEGSVDEASSNACSDDEDDFFSAEHDGVQGEQITKCVTASSLPRSKSNGTFNV